MQRIELWNACNATRTPTKLKVEKVLSTAYTADQYTEVVLSTPDSKDISGLTIDCQNNLMVNGVSDHVLYDITIIGLHEDVGRYFVTVAAEHWTGVWS